MFRVIMSPTPFRQQANIFPCPSFAAEVSVGALLVALHICHLIQLPGGFWLSQPRPCMLRQFLYVYLQLEI